MKNITSDQYEVGPQLDRPVDRAPECRRDVRLALVDPRRRQPLILAVPDVQIREMDQAHSLSFLPAR
jgi:hypothetical protein